MTPESGTTRFWETIALEQMTELQWESLCDGCGKCCLHKIEDEDTEEVFYTQVACKLLDIETCRCSNYAQRQQYVPDCLNLRDGFRQWQWLPVSCAYRLLSEGKPLPEWHYLVSNDHEAVHQQRSAIRHWALPENSDTLPSDHVLENFE